MQSSEEKKQGQNKSLIDTISSYRWKKGSMINYRLPYHKSRDAIASEKLFKNCPMLGKIKIQITTLPILWPYDIPTKTMAFC